MRQEKTRQEKTRQIKARQIKALLLFAGIACGSGLVYGSAGAQQPSDAATREALKAAMLDEAFSAAKYKLFAEHARRWLIPLSHVHLDMVLGTD